METIRCKMVTYFKILERSEKDSKKSLQETKTEKCRNMLIIRNND